MKNKLYFYTKRVKIPIYQGFFHIILSNDISKVKDKDHNFPYEKVFAHAIEFESNDTNKVLVILNFDHEYAKINPGIIAHEAFHVANFILDNRGVERSTDSEEAHAYFLQWVVDEIYKFIYKCKLENRIYL